MPPEARCGNRATLAAAEGGNDAECGGTGANIPTGALLPAEEWVGNSQLLPGKEEIPDDAEGDEGARLEDADGGIDDDDSGGPAKKVERRLDILA